MHLHKEYITENLLNSTVRKRVKTHSDVASYYTLFESPADIIAQARERLQLSTDDLERVHSCTKAKKNIQCKYYHKNPWCINDSINDKPEFDRRLKLFLHRRKKLDVLNFVQKQKKEAHSDLYNNNKLAAGSRRIDIPTVGIPKRKQLLNCPEFMRPQPKSKLNCPGLCSAQISNIPGHSGMKRTRLYSNNSKTVLPH